MQIEEEEFKYKLLSKRELEVSLKRLVRFKYPLDKKLRVYKQILTKNTIDPKISTKVFNSMKKSQIDRLVQIIWNNSQLQQSSVNIWQDDIRCFSSKRMLEDILGVSLPNEIVPKVLAKSIQECGYKPSKTARTYDDFYLDIQSQFSLNIPKDIVLPKIKLVLLVEGATEEILLPKFAKKIGIDFEKEGVLIIASGGKNQVAKSYLEQKYTLKLPIVILLDSDAQEQADDIQKVIRPQDKIRLIQEGEFEDIIAPKLILKALNKEFKNTGKVIASDLKKGLPMTTTLYELYKEKGFGDFKKVEFAKTILSNIDTPEDVSDELEKLLRSFL